MYRILIFILFFTLNSFSQKEYRFDYFLEYENTFFKEDSLKQQKIYLTNSKDNSYLAILVDRDSLLYDLTFKDENGLVSHSKVLKSAFYKAEFISIACNEINKYVNNFKYRTKEYDFFNYPDTLINKSRYNVYKLKSIIKPKKRVRRHIGTNIYIVDKTKSFHLPVLEHSTAYEEWKLERNIPNGIFIEKKFINHLGEDHNSEKLISFVKIDKKIVIPNECDYTKD